MMYSLYYAAASLAAPFGAAWLAANAKHRPLLGRLNPRRPALQGRPIWVHACSVGEVGTAWPIIQAMGERWPQSSIVLTVSTTTGRSRAESLCQGVPVTWFPFDHPGIMRRFVKAMDPRVLVLIETELWPAAVRETRHFGAPVVLVNGRLSDKHFARYRRVRFFMGPIVGLLSAAGMQTEEYASRIKELGAHPSKVHVTGNTKFDGVATEVEASQREALCRENGFSAEGPVLLFGSTRPGDEGLAASCWRQLRDRFPALRLIVAPRHIDRLSEAVEPFDEPLLLRSSVKAGQAPAGERVFILDTVGELAGFYSIATVAVIGGSFFPGVEGHNPLEPAALGVPTVFGPFMSNFPEPSKVLLERGGARQAPSPESLLAILEELLGSETARASMAEGGRKAVLDNQGAIQRNLDLVAPFVDGTA